MKRLLPLWAAVFFCIALVSSFSAFAQEEFVTVTYRYEDETIVSSSVQAGAEMSPLSYTTAKNHLKQKNIDLDDGTVYEWRMGSPTGAVVTSFVADEDVVLYLVPTSATDRKCVVTYRFDFFDNNTFRSETIEYSYGESFSPPETVDGQKINVSELYLSPAYATKDNNMWDIPDYIEEDKTVYVVLAEPAHVTLDGEAYATPYGRAPVPPAQPKNFRHVGFFTDPEHTRPFTGAAVNGLTLYSLSERISFTLTTSISGVETERTVPIGDNVVAKDVLSEKYAWFDESGRQVAVPYEVNRDTVLTGRGVNAVREEEAVETAEKLSSEEVAAIVIVAAVFLAIGIYSLFRYLYKKGKLPRKKVSQEKTDNDKE